MGATVSFPAAPVGCRCPHGGSAPRFTPYSGRTNQMFRADATIGAGPRKITSTAAFVIPAEVRNIPGILFESQLRLRTKLQ